ncbi:MAG: DUF2975 domain-containing protein [Actinomycetota bacterium]
MSTPKQTTLSRGDSGALIGFVLSGIAIAAWSTIASVMRIVELARGTDVPVFIEFFSRETEVDLEAGDGTVSVALDSAVLTAPQLTPIATVPGIIGQVVTIITVLAVVGCLILLARSILRGQVFSRRNTRLVMTTGFTGLVGIAASTFFDSMLANATVSIVTDNTIRNSVLTVEPFTFVLGAFIIAVIGTAFAVGDRLQRETEGLV